MIGISYHKDYDKYDLGTDHPLIGDKPTKFMKFIEEKKIIEYCDIFTPKKADVKYLLKVHTKEYVKRIEELSKTGGRLSLDTPAPKGIFEYACLATGGTILAGVKLFDKYNITVNPLAGFHHAGISSSSGFCFFNDIAVVIEYIREQYNIKKFMIVDLDVHHGNGTQEIYYSDPTVLSISFHQNGNTLYPGTGFIEEIGEGEGKGFNVNLPLPPGTGNLNYLKAFDSIIPALSSQFKPEIIIYQSGVDTHHADPLADLNLTYQTYYNLALRMKEISNSTCNKLLVLFGGGYNSTSCIKSYYNIFCGLLGEKGFIKENVFPDYSGGKIDKLIDEIKTQLSLYWNF
ncbi:MAG: acetoin utilization protein AcuC [Candidatus Thermoplasmatota archaeon]|nr:acetoin utilization protein AcuC [Candidatus Thermoplasmatota archaeon]